MLDTKSDRIAPTVWVLLVDILVNRLPLGSVLRSTYFFHASFSGKRDDFAVASSSGLFIDMLERIGTSVEVCVAKSDTREG